MKSGYRSGNYIIRRISITLAVLCLLAAGVLAVILPNIEINEKNLKVLRIPFTDRVIFLEQAEFHDPSHVEVPQTEEVDAPVRPVEGTSYQERIERAVFLPYHLMFDPAAVDAFLASIRGRGVNTVIIEAKAPSGALAFQSQAAMAEGASAESNEPLLALKAKLTGEGYAVVASFSCFRDNTLPQSRPDLGLLTADGKLWSDSMRYAWLDPYREDTQVYLLTLLSELYGLGFHEILLQNFAFPSMNGAELIAMDAELATKEAKSARMDEILFQLTGFADERADLSLAARYDGAEGQSMQAFANFFHRIYLPLENGVESAIDTAPITEFSALLGEGTLPYRLVPLYSLSERVSAEVFEMKRATEEFGVGYFFDSSEAVYDPLLFEE